ncbi:hypothetical protein [Streptomyces phaeochromogenes]|uniref:hypothetical protein n=1 Tax=Streptomyces phaeochromogenes TaxID=1923 RepID=UPI003866526D|nr:hypothetical protein OHB08_26165 [Streptomyces phaeochromogenes]
MTPWLRPLRVTGLLLVLLAGPAPMSYAVPHVSSYEPAPGESRAGSRAGEGRERPGRAPTPTKETEETEEEQQEEQDEEAAPDEAQEEAQDEDAGVGHPDGPADGEQSEGAVAPETPGNTAPRSHPPFDAEQAAGRHVRASEPVLRVLPLGSGLVLIGLGLGLAFVALRVRRA